MTGAVARVGADTRPMAGAKESEAEASEVAAAWAFHEGSKAVVCSLPSGDGGSSVDILGKHMAR